MRRAGRRTLSAVVLALTLAGCGQGEEVRSNEELRELVQQGRVGRASDRWIEVLNNAGEWERTGLIFGFRDDDEECAKVIRGFRAAYPAREYRCEPAN
jgi:hypothetical protein